MAKFQNTFNKLIDDINIQTQYLPEYQDYTQALNRINSHMKGHIKLMLEKEVLLQTIRSPDGLITKHQLISKNVDQNPENITGSGLHDYGFAKFQYGTSENLETKSFLKTPFFTALLMIDGLEVLANKLIDIAPAQILFNKVGTSGDLPISLVMYPKNETSQEIARKLIDKNGFSLKDYSIDKHEKSSSLVIEMLHRCNNVDLLSYMIASNNFNFDELCELDGFSSTFNSITPLMYYAQVGNFEFVKILVEEAKVDINIEVYSKLRQGVGCNAISFAKNNMDIVEYLITNGCPYLGSTVGLIDLTMDKNIGVLTTYADQVKKLLAERSFLEQSIKIIEDDQITKDKALEKIDQIIEARELSLPEQIVEVEPEETLNQDLEEETIDSLLLKFFITKDEDLASRIANICMNSPEIAVDLITVLNNNEQYFEHPDIEQFVHNFIYDQSLIHKYFQTRKEIVQIKMQTLDENSENLGWNTGEYGFVSFEDTISISSTLHSDLYIKIGDSVADSVNSGLDNLKVLPVNSLNKNGVKFRSDLKIAILKTNSLGDSRLVAEGMYKNEDGKLLLYFSDICNHTQVENWSKQHLTYIDEHALAIEESNVDIIGSNEEDDSIDLFDV